MIEVIDLIVIVSFPAGLAIGILGTRFVFWLFRRQIDEMSSSGSD